MGSHRGTARATVQRLVSVLGVEASEIWIAYASHGMLRDDPVTVVAASSSQTAQQVARERLHSRLASFAGSVRVAALDDCSEDDLSAALLEDEKHRVIRKSQDP